MQNMKKQGRIHSFTATKIACGQGPYVRSLDHLDRCIEAKDCKKKTKNLSVTDRPMDGPTDRPMDRRTNKAGCRVA